MPTPDSHWPGSASTLRKCSIPKPASSWHRGLPHAKPCLPSCSLPGSVPCPGLFFPLFKRALTTIHPITQISISTAGAVYPIWYPNTGAVPRVEIEVSLKLKPYLGQDWGRWSPPQNSHTTPLLAILGQRLDPNHRVRNRSGPGVSKTLNIFLIGMLLLMTMSTTPTMSIYSQTRTF